ncbi:Head fiber protein [Bacillus timonensis]|uniref:Head fiber protein n=1 Tax=Bacillus timonensis TaxID=1033734 RepID=A0A4S3PWQ0_9BACI|nr:head fiber protein [Bacillus timonensis]THE14004.1 Head fiber protein [Bacillus timonensis]
MSNVKNYTEQGGEKTVIGGTLEVTPTGKLSFDGAEVRPADAQGDSTAADVVSLVADFNALLAKLKAAGLMNAD